MNYEIGVFEQQKVTKLLFSLISSHYSTKFYYASYSMCHIKGSFGVTIVSTFSVHYPSITSTHLVDPPPMETIYMAHASCTLFIK